MTRILDKIYGFTLKHSVFLIVVFIISVSLSRAVYLPEGDVFWSTRNGLDILDSGTIHIFINDTWNAQSLGDVWSPNSWLWNVILAVFYRGFGTFGFFLITFLCNAAIYVLIWLLVRKFSLHPLLQLGVVALTWGFLSVYLNGRANMVDVLLILGFAYLLSYITAKSFSFLKLSLIVLPVTFLFTVLWANLHLTAIIAVGFFPLLLFFFLYDRTVKQRWLLSGSVGLVTAVGLTVSPFGVESLLKVSLVANESKGFFYEWANVFQAGPLAVPLIVAAVTAFLLVVVAAKQKQWVFALGLFGFILLSLDTIRFLPFLTVLIVLASKNVHTIRLPLKEFPKVLSVVAWLAVTALVIAAGFSTVRFAADVETVLPTPERNFVSIPQNATVLTGVAESGVILLYRPDVKVVLDGRNDMLGKERFSVATEMLFTENLTDFSDFVSKYNIDAVYVPSEEEYPMLGVNSEKIGFVAERNGDSVTWVKK